MGFGVGTIWGAADVAAVTTLFIIAGCLLLLMLWARNPFVASLSEAKDIWSAE